MVGCDMPQSAPLEMLVEAPRTLRAAVHEAGHTPAEMTIERKVVVNWGAIDWDRGLCGNAQGQIVYCENGGPGELAGDLVPQMAVDSHDFVKVHPDSAWAGHEWGIRAVSFTPHGQHKMPRNPLNGRGASLTVECKRREGGGNHRSADGMEIEVTVKVEGLGDRRLTGKVCAS